MSETTYGVHEFLTVRTNADVPVPDYFRGATAAADDVLVVEERDALAVPDESWSRRLASHRYWFDGDALTVRYPSTPTGKQVCVRLEGLGEKRTRLAYTPAFRRMTDFDGLFEGLLATKLLDRGVAVVHAGGLVTGDRAVLLASMGRMGKTSTILSVADARGDLRFMGDNILLLDENGTAYAWPATVGVFPGTVVADDRLDRATRLRVRAKRLAARSDLLVALLLHKFSIDLSETVAPTEIANGIAARAPVNRLYLLNGGRPGGGERVLDLDAAIAKVATGTDMELDPDDYYLSLYAFAGDEIDVHPSVVKRRRSEVLTRALRDVERVELLASNPGEYAAHVDLDTTENP